MQHELQKDPSIVEKLAFSGPNVEVWWDSSPLVFPNWAERVLHEAPAEERDTLAAQIKRLYDPENPTATLFRGVTTNPPLSLAAIHDDPTRWQTWINEYLKTHPQADEEEVAWNLYKEVVIRGAKAFQPLFEASGYRYGHISAQVYPRAAFDEKTMLAQALELSTLAPNVMIKCPGSAEGIRVIRQLTARGIPTNSTLCFVVPQFVAVAEAVLEGLAEARANGVDLTRWRSVVTDMSARWEDAAEFKQQTQEAGIDLTVELKRYASVAVFKAAHRLFRQRGYPSKMLICSLRLGPKVNGEQRVWHLEHIAGADAVFTLPPVYIAGLLKEVNAIDLHNTIWDETPREVMEQLEKIPYFTRAIRPDGYTTAEFNSLEPLMSTFKEFSGATEKMIDFVGTYMKARAHEYEGA